LSEQTIGLPGTNIASTPNATYIVRLIAISYIRYPSYIRCIMFGDS